MIWILAAALPVIGLVMWVTFLLVGRSIFSEMANRPEEDGSDGERR